VYFIISAALFKSVKFRDNILASAIVGFVVSGFFHFSARHFVFWLGVGVLFQYLYAARFTSANTDKTNSCKASNSNS